jgi:hypothetical protein
MIMAASGDDLKVTGNNNDMAPTGPMPGKTPMRVPINTPIKQYNKFKGCSAMLKPSPR